MDITLEKKLCGYKQIALEKVCSLLSSIIKELFEIPLKLDKNSKLTKLFSSSKTFCFRSLDEKI